MLDECLDDLVLRDGLDDLAMDEDLPLAVARRAAEVRLAGLTGAVDDAAHDGHAQRGADGLQALLDGLGEGPHVHLGAPAGGAGDDLEFALAQAHELQELGADLDLLDRRCGQGDADGVPDALGEQRAEGGAGLDGALEGGARLGHPEVEGPVALLAQQLVGLHHGDDVVVLDRDLEIVEAALLEEAGLPDGGLHEGLRGGLAVLLEQARVQGACVDADAQAHPGVGGGLADRRDLVVELSDVAGVNAHRAASGLNGGEDVLGVEVDVRDDGDARLLGDDGQRLGVLVRRAGDPDDVAAGGGELRDLLEGGADVVGLRRRHRLHGDGGVTADEQVSDPDLAGGLAGGENRALLAHGGDAKGDRFSHALQYVTALRARTTPPGVVSAMSHHGTGRLGASLKELLNKAATTAR